LTPANVSPAWDGETADNPILSAIARAIRHFRDKDFRLKRPIDALTIAIRDAALYTNGTIFIPPCMPFDSHYSVSRFTYNVFRSTMRREPAMCTYGCGIGRFEESEFRTFIILFDFLLRPWILDTGRSAEKYPASHHREQPTIIP
jgi:hypothetical protein